MRMICAVTYTGVQVVPQSVDLEEGSETETEIGETEDAEIVATVIDHVTGTLIIAEAMM